MWIHGPRVTKTMFLLRHTNTKLNGQFRPVWSTTASFSRHFMYLFQFLEHNQVSAPNRIDMNCCTLYYSGVATDCKYGKYTNK